MYTVEVIFRGDSNCKYAVATGRELFNLLWCLDTSTCCVAFKIGDGYTPEDFGWGDFKKFKCSFTQQDYIESHT